MRTGAALLPWAHSWGATGRVPTAAAAALVRWRLEGWGGGVLSLCVSSDGACVVHAVPGIVGRPAPARCAQRAQNACLSVQTAAGLPGFPSVARGNGASDNSAA